MILQLLKVVLMLLLSSSWGFTNNLAINNHHYFAVTTPQKCTPYQQNLFVYRVLHDSYLWSREIPHLSEQKIRSYPSPQALLQALRHPKDRFSYIEMLEDADNFFVKGNFHNFGFIPFFITLKSQKKAFIVGYVYPNSPAYQAGLRRGAIITHIDNKEVSQAHLPHIDQKLKGDHNIPFIFWRNHKKYQRIIKKYNYRVQTITQPHIYRLDDKKIGYLVLSDFLSFRRAELDNYFQTFKRRGIDELILDLRYNGGGDVEMANYITSLIAGESIANQPSEYIRYNDKYKHLNKTLFFQDLPPQKELNLKRLFILTTQQTCSASERLIHNLKAYPDKIEVIQIGERTCGKPYGFYGAGVFCNRVLLSINTISENSRGEIIDSQGIEPTCTRQENLNQKLGEESESYLKAALYYIKNGVCL